MTIYYFTATGNCLYTARQFDAAFISIPGAIKKEQYTCKDDVIGIISPVFWLSVPSYIEEFIQKLEIECDYFFGILTYGSFPCAAPDQLGKVVTKNGRSFDYINTINMTENYLPMFEMKQEIKKAEAFHIEENLAQLKRDILERKHYQKKSSLLEKLLTAMKKKHAVTGVGETENFVVESTCMQCGQCTRLCPTGNIQITEGKVTFGKQCTSCLACTHNCPNNAIRLKNEKSKERFRNPNITLRELTAWREK